MGGELFYRTRGRTMAVDVAGTDELTLGTPRFLFEASQTGDGRPFGISPDGQRLVTSGASDSRLSGPESSRVQLWDVATSELVGDLVGHELPVAWSEFSPGGERFVSVCAGGQARQWDSRGHFFRFEGEPELGIFTDPSR